MSGCFVTRSSVWWWAGALSNTITIFLLRKQFWNTLEAFTTL
ncbi:hypothetical protein PC116_g8772 [Phytophthora cactorum]|nr:hypothetical protein PC116_g8772 [Phytophthora cactorum]